MTLALAAVAMMRTVRRMARVAARPFSRVMVAVGLMTALNACAIPPIVSVAKLAADGVLFASTGKTSTDHGLSMVTGKDCETFRVLEQQNICQDAVLAQAEAVPAEIERDRAAVDVLALTAPADVEARRALADQALAQAFQPPAASRQPAVAVAALPRPVDPGSVRVAVRTETPRAPQVVASATPSRVVAARPGLIKVAAAIPRPPVTKVALRGTVAKPKPTVVRGAAAPAAPRVVPQQVVPQGDRAAPDRAGAIKRLGLILKKALGIPDSGG